MAYDAVNMADWQISEAAEKNMPTLMNGARNLGWKKRKCSPWGASPNSIFSKSSIV